MFNSKPYETDRIVDDPDDPYIENSPDPFDNDYEDEE